MTKIGMGYFEKLNNRKEIMLEIKLLANDRREYWK